MSGDDRPVTQSWEFDSDTAVEGSESRYSTVLTDRWNIGTVPNGGYVLGSLVRAASREVSHPDPLAVSAHYLAPALVGPAAIHVDVLKRGRTVSTVTALIIQDERVRVASTITFADLDTFDGPEAITASPPSLTADLMPDRLKGSFPIDERFNVEVTPYEPGSAADADFVGRIRFADGRPPDVLALPLLVDGFTPAVFRLGHVGWSPTLELTVHVRNRPSPGWIHARVGTRMLDRGLFEEDVELWDEAGRLVAHSRQLGMTSRTGAYEVTPGTPRP